MLMQSDGQSAADGDDVISLYVPAGTYALEVQSLGGAGTYSLTATSSPATSPFQPIAVGNDPSSIISGDFTGDGILDLAVANAGADTVSVLLGNGDGTFAPQVTYAGRGPIRTRSWRGTSPATATSTWPSPTPAPTRCRCCWATATAPSRPRSLTRSGSDPDAIVAGDFTGDGHLDLAVANEYSDGTVSVLLGNGDGTFAPQVTYAVGSRVPMPSWRGTSPATASLDLAVVNANYGGRHGVGVAGQRRRHLRAPVTYAVGVRSGRDRGRGLHRRRPPRPGRRQRPSSPSPTRCRCCWATATAPSRPRSPTRSADRSGRDRGRGLHRRRPPRPGRRQRGVRHGVGAAGQWRRHLRAPGHLRGRGSRSGRDRGGGLHRRRPPRPGRRQPERRHGVGAAGQWRRHFPAAEPTQRRRRGPRSGRDRGRGLHRRRAPRPGRRQHYQRHGVGAAGQRRRHFPAPGHLRRRVRAGRDRGRGLQWRRPDSIWPSPTPAYRQGTVSVLLGNGDGTFQPQVTYAGRGPIRSRSWRGTSPATALDLAVANVTAATRCRCCWATATAPSSPRSPTPSGSVPDAIVAGDFTGDGHLDLAVANAVGDTVSVLLGNGDGTFGPRSAYAGRVGPDRDRGGGLHRRRPASTWPSPTPATTRCRCCWATATAPSAPGHLRGRDRSGRDRGRGLHRRRPPRPGRHQRRLDDTVSVLLGNGDGTFRPQVTYAVGVGPGRDRGRGLHRRRPPRPGRRQRGLRHGLGAAGQRRRHVHRPRPARHHPLCHAPGGRRQRRRHRRCPGRRRRRRHPLSPGHPRPARHVPPARHGQPRHSPRATSPGCRIPIRARCWPASTPTTMPSRSTPGAMAASSGSARSPPGRSRRRSSRPTSTATAWTTWSSATPATARSRSSSTHGPGSFAPGLRPRSCRPSTLAVGLGVSDVQAVDTTRPTASSTWSSPTS